MNERYMQFDDSESPCLAHYGVLGMKWGVRHNPQRAYEKSKRKALKFQKKIDKQTAKANKKFSKGVSRSGGLFGSQERADRMFAKSKKHSRKALMQAQKGAKWISRMEKEFANQSAVTMEQSLIDLGKSYNARVTSAADQIYLRNI